MSSELDLSDVVGGMFGFTNLTITRTPSPSFNAHGVAVPGGTSTVQVNGCSVQPAGGRDLDRLEEGQRRRGAVVVFSTAELRIAGPGLSDRFDFEGENFTVVQSQPWDVTGYWRSLAVRTEV